MLSLFFYNFKFHRNELFKFIISSFSIQYSSILAYQLFLLKFTHFFCGTKIDDTRSLIDDNLPRYFSRMFNDLPKFVIDWINCRFN